MVTVKRKPQDTNDGLINRFRQLVQETGIIPELRQRDRHVKAAKKRQEEKKERDRLIKLREKKNRR